MFSTLRKIIGNINIVLSGNMVTIEGLPTEVYLADVYKIWRTSKIEDYMFSKRTSASITFHQFFLPDVLYTIEAVLKSPRRGSGFNYRALNKVIERLREDTWIKKTLERQPSILDYTALKALNVNLLEHQAEFLGIYDDLVPRYNLTGYMLAATPGSGKTLTGLALSLCLHADVTICIVPKNSVDEVWAGTLQSRFKEPQLYWASTSNEPLVPGKKYYIFHYEQLGRAMEFFTKHMPVNPVVILDESHNMNEADSLRTMLFVSLCKQIRSHHVLWASGTPIKAIGNEAIPFLSTVDPLFDKTAMERFKKIYGKSVARAVDILRNRIGNLTFKVDRAVVITNEVEKVTKKIKMPTAKLYTLEAIRTDMQNFIADRLKYYKDNMVMFQRMYDDGLAEHQEQIKSNPKKQHDFAVYKDYVKTLRRGYDAKEMKVEVMYCNQYELKEIIPFLSIKNKEGFKQSRSVIKYLELKVQGEALGRILGKKRMQCNVDMVEYAGLQEEIDSARKKTVIFTSYVEVVDKVVEMLERDGYKPLKVYGATNKDLPAIVSQFNKDEDANPVVATFMSLSTAVPLVAASTAIMLNSPFRAHELDQARARIDRIGQDGSVTFVDVFLDTGEEPNISTRSGDILNWSREMVNAIMGTDYVDINEATMEEFSDGEYRPAQLSFTPPEQKPGFLSW